jgi:hypothetical protein
MDARTIENARQAVAMLRQSLGDNPETWRGVVASGGAEVQMVNGLAVYLLGRHSDPDELRRDLADLDLVLVERQAEKLLDGIDWDRLN